MDRTVLCVSRQNRPRFDRIAYPRETELEQFAIRGKDRCVIRLPAKKRQAARVPRTFVWKKDDQSFGSITCRSTSDWRVTRSTSPVRRHLRRSNPRKVSIPLCSTIQLLERTRTNVPGSVDGSYPTITKLSRRLHVIFCHQSVRPERYGLSRCLAMMPSSQELRFRVGSV